MEKFKSILKSSSLSLSMSDMEIDEIIEEIKPDFEDYLEQEKEKIIEDHYSSEIEDLEEKAEILKSKNRDLEERIIDLEDQSIKIETLRDDMTIRWVKENWEEISKLMEMNISGKEILKKLSIDATELISQILKKEIETVSAHKRIVLVGRAASGKDHFRKILEERGFKYATSYTTRPPRADEVNGKDYYFLSEEEFQRMVDKNEFYEHISFNNWKYGTSSEQFYKDDVFIMTPYGLSKVNPEDRKNTFVIFFDIDENVRRERMSQRNDADSVDRRIVSDDIDFENFTDFDIKITNPNF